MELGNDTSHYAVDRPENSADTRSFLMRLKEQGLLNSCAAV
jgi:hypothetical protein